MINVDLFFFFSFPAFIYFPRVAPEKPRGRFTVHVLGLFRGIFSLATRAFLIVYGDK